MGNRDGRGRRARGRCGGSRRGAGPLHRRDRPRLPVARMHLRASSGSTSTGAPSVQLRAHAEPALRGRFRSPGGGLPQARRRRPVDQVRGRARRGATASRPGRPGTSRSKSRPISTWRCTGCSRAQRSSSTPWVTSTCCRRCSTPRAVRTPAGRAVDGAACLRPRAGSAVRLLVAASRNTIQPGRLQTVACRRPRSRRYLRSGIGAPCVLGRLGFRAPDRDRISERDHESRR